jgi:eukaryotic-like serine/threonine-protein kinase
MADHLEVGQVIADRYQVEAHIGAGGIADVYRVRHLELGSAHALKLLAWRRPQLAERFEREGRFQAQLGHPNVVAVTDFLRFDGQVALVMEYVDGPSLEQYLTERGAFPPSEALGVFVQILAAVCAAHDRQVWHRDLKPANVLLATSGRGFVPKVADFGIAKFVQEEMGSGTKTGIAMGSPGYIAPEQVRDSSSVDARADIFALGAILYELFTGRRAFADSSGEVTLSSTLEREVPSLAGPGIDPRVADAVRRATAQEREDRFPDCRSFAAALGAADDPLFIPRPAAAAPLSGGFSSPTPRVTNGAYTTPPVTISDDRRRLARLGLGLFGVGALGSTALIAGLVTVSLLSAPRPPAADPSLPSVDPTPVPAFEVAPPPIAPVLLPPAPVDPAPVRPTAPAPATGTDDAVAEVEPPAPAPLVEPVAVAPFSSPPVASPPAADPAPVPAPADATTVDPMLQLGGVTWRGSAASTPLEIRFTGVVEGRVLAEVVTIAGANRTQRKASGTFDPRTGLLQLTATDGSVYTGQLRGAAIQGKYARSAGGKELDWLVRR